MLIHLWRVLVVGVILAATACSQNRGANAESSSKIGSQSSALTATRPSSNTGIGFFASGGHVFDANGSEFIIRGTNYEVWAAVTDQNAAIAGMNNAKLNAARLNFPAGTYAGTETVNAATVQRFIDAGIVPIPGIWSPDGQWNVITTCNSDPNLLTTVVDNWVGPQKDWLISKEKYIILNIANEWGEADTAWSDAYITAVTRIRTAGIKAMIMIDAGGACAQLAQSIESYGQAIMDADPQRNIVFSVHMYAFWRDVGDLEIGSWPESPRTPYDTIEELQRLKDTGHPIVVGEYCGWQGGGDETCKYTLTNALAAYESKGIGYMSWEWMNIHNDFASVTINNVYNNTSSDLSSWGQTTIEHATLGSKALGQKATIFAACTSGANCNDGNPCTTDTCTAGVCSHPSVSEGTTCSDGVFCNGAETCHSGSCTAGTAVDCNDNNGCTTDSCSNPSSACVHTPISGCGGTSCTTGADCNDNNACTSDTCTANVCSHANLSNGASCSDGQYCNGAETCQSGLCTPGTAIVCNDSNPCTTDSCSNPSSGCVYANKSNGTSCSDGLVCNGPETCQSGTCTAGTAIVCNDNNPCTTDSCNNPGAECVYTPISGCAGSQTQLVGLDSGGSDDYQASGEAWAWSYTATASGTATRLELFLTSSSTASALKLALYSNSAGHPGTLLASGTISGTPVTNTWNSVPISVSITAGTTYWLAALQPTGSTGTLHYDTMNTGNGNEYPSSANPTLSAFQSTWTSGNAFFGFQATFRVVDGSSNPPPPPPTDTSRYNFEAGTQSWNTSTGGITFTRSSTERFAGTYSLADSISATGAQTISSQVDNPTAAANATITSHVWCPVGAPLSVVTAWVVHGGTANGSCGAFQWFGNSTDIVGGQWNTLSIAVPSCSLGLAHLGVDFVTTGAWTGTCYTDTVNW